MQIIRRIEIKYFRSIYSATLKQCSELNILSGRNDVGKSNVLRALNLFFNGNTDWEAPLVFEQDFSLQRLEQVRKESVKGKQFIQVAIEFERPSNFKGSLPGKFTVKRTWYRDQSQHVQSDNLVSLEQSGKCPSSLATAQRMLPKFLNRVRFEYVPAVRDRAFFNHLLARLQSSLLGVSLDETNPITPLADNLASHIGDQVAGLREDFSRATGLDTSFEPPGQLASLFQAFQVSVPSGEGQISLSLRGDGMQSRYIPSVLHYIASKTPAFFIWGFEEPENSLEYSNADQLAADFQNLYSKAAQIFLTSHSPAIVSRQGEALSLYRVWQPDSKTDVERIALPLKASESGQELEKEIGLLRIQQEIHAEYRAKLQELQFIEQRVEQLEAELIGHTMPLVLVEGSTDFSILTAAWAKLYPDSPMPFLVRAADPLANQSKVSAAGASAVAKAIESIHPADNRKVLAIFDHDDEGVKAFDRLSKNFSEIAGSPYLKRHANGYAFAATLGLTQVENPLVAARNLCIEFLFEKETLELKDTAGHGLVIEAQPLLIAVGGTKLQLGQAELDIVKGAIGDLSTHAHITGGKKVFAETIVPTLNIEAFANFTSLFEGIKGVLGDGD